MTRRPEGRVVGVDRLVRSVPRGRHLAPALAASPLTERGLPPGGPFVLVPPEGSHARWRPGERLPDVIAERCVGLSGAGRGDHLAVDGGDVVFSYGELFDGACRLARELLTRGIRPGDHVAVLVDRSPRTAITLLALLELGAAYVPLDPAFPAERIHFILDDAEVSTILTTGGLQRLVEDPAIPVVVLEEALRAARRRLPTRLTAVERGGVPADLCYIVYTSGSTGRPKGVAVDHPSICNFVRVAAECYGLTEADRVFQGMTIAFDFSVEELWVPLAAGATLVPNTTGAALAGDDLWAFLAERRVTALCCVPTLLATLTADLPDLRWLLVSGEACPPELADRWHRRGRTILNVYGPTETTVTATWADLVPGEPVTIGRPLPSYSVVIVDEEHPRPLARGEVGEIAIGGIGVARGYLNREELTSSRFVDDFVGMPDNPSGRIYRTGDRGRIDEQGRIEYHGRIDDQVKLRGYRIELGEIEAELLRHAGIAQAVVAVRRLAEADELVAYYTCRSGARVDEERLVESLRERLPGYMVPPFLERLPALPRLPSDKVDRSRLPPPTRPRRVGAGFVAPVSPIEESAAALLAEVLGTERVSVEADFFGELGANSLSMARFCAGLRAELGTTGPSMPDVYGNPTVRSLVEALEDAGGEEQVPSAPPPSSTAGPVAHVVCGTLQAITYLLASLLVAGLGFLGYDWLVESRGLLDAYLRAMAVAATFTAVLFIIPIALKWLLAGRFRPTTFPIWSLAYFRFWVVRNAVRLSPAVVFAGSPLYNLYLRMLGARVGKGAVILTRTVPACPDLISVGEGAVVEKDVRMSGFVARAGSIVTGRVEVGDGAHVGDRCVLDIDSAMGLRARLAHASALHRGQTVPAGAVYHGSPAVPAGADTLPPPPAAWAPGMSRGRVVVYSLAQLANLVAVAGPLGIGWVAIAFLIDVRRPLPAAALFAGSVLGGLVIAFTVPRLVGKLVHAGRPHPLYGIRWAAFRTVRGLTNSRFQNLLFGDSSYIVGYLRLVGVRLSKEGQTGSNFGVTQKWDFPYLSRIGSGTLVSDGISIVNLRISPTSFSVSTAAIGGDNFFGNNVVYPAGGRTGEDCLLATKVLVPLSGDVLEHAGLLGSPSFPIPRSVLRDSRFDHLRQGSALAEGLARKNRSNLATMALFLLTRWVRFYGSILVGVTFTTAGGSPSPAGLAVGLVAALGWGILLLAVLEWTTLGFRRLSPFDCSIYQRPYWRHERYWKLADPGLVTMLNGTPFKAAAWRLMGTRVGRRLYDGGCTITERSLVEIGDDCTLDEGTALQSHSLEDAVFKSGRIRLADRCTVGPAGYVHYGVEIGSDAVLEADSFLMKGETVPTGADWGGNPARPLAGVRR